MNLKTVHITRMQNGRYRLIYKFLWFSWSPTFGDGCGNDTGVPVEYDTAEEVLGWYNRDKKRDKICYY